MNIVLGPGGGWEVACFLFFAPPPRSRLVPPARGWSPPKRQWPAKWKRICEGLLGRWQFRG
jgi:hypothetical protein